MNGGADTVDMFQSPPSGDRVRTMPEYCEAAGNFLFQSPPSGDGSTLLHPGRRGRGESGVSVPSKRRSGSDIYTTFDTHFAHQWFQSPPSGDGVRTRPGRVRRLGPVVVSVPSKRG